MSSNDDDNKNNDSSKGISIRRSTFNKIIILSVAALMVSAFFGGYILRGNIMEANTSSLINAAIVQQLQQQGGVAGAPNQQQQQPTTVEDQQQPPPTKIQSVSLDGAITMGKQDAPVTMVEFSDFQCPFCKRHFDDSFNQIEQEYVATGQVRYVYKHYPLDFHQNAKQAAVAAECTNEQGKFWEYHDVLFQKQTEWETQDANATATTFKKYATDLGLNAGSFNTCLDSNKYAEKVDKELQEGSTYGVSGTPTFFIGNEQQGYTQVVGAQPFTTLKQTIDQALQGG